MRRPVAQRAHFSNHSIEYMNRNLSLMLFLVLALGGGFVLGSSAFRLFGKSWTLRKIACVRKGSLEYTLRQNNHLVGKGDAIRVALS